MRKLLIVSALCGGVYVAWRWYASSRDVEETEEETEEESDGGGFFSGAVESVAEIVDGATMGIFKLSRMAQVTQDDVDDANVQAFLRVIRQGEGTADAGGYRRIYGGQMFSDLSDHPRVYVTKNGITSSAAGAYQFLERTWDETAGLMNLDDFSEGNQDFAAVGRIAARGALELVKAGYFDQAVQACAKEWASLPGSPYGQPTISMDKAKTVYMKSGGVFA